jgi:hypothetical protein
MRFFTDGAVVPLTGPSSEPRGHIGRIVAGSLATGVLAGLLLVGAPFIPTQENAVTGALLCGFATGWAMLAVLSLRYTTRPQRGAAVPAAFMGLDGILLIGFGSGGARRARLGSGRPSCRSSITTGQRHGQHSLHVTGSDFAREFVPGGPTSPRCSP